MFILYTFVWILLNVDKALIYVKCLSHVIWFLVYEMFLILVCKFINIFFPQYYLNGCFYLSPSYWNMLFSFIVFFQVILLKFKTHCRLLSFVCFYLSPSYWNMYAFFHSLLSSRWFFVIQNPLQTKFCLFLSVTLILKHVCIFHSLLSSRWFL